MKRTIAIFYLKTGLAKCYTITGSLVFGLVFLFACTSHKPNKQDRPNVVLILVDDLNDWVGHLNGHSQSVTPNIDQLASRGTTFVNAHTNAPLCGPSRTSMLTGLRPSSTGVYFHINDRELAEHVRDSLPHVTFLPDYFEQHGYRTFGVGKIFHHGDGGKVFDEYGGLADFGPRPKNRFHYDPEWFGKPAGTSTDWGAFPVHDSLTFDARIADWAIRKLKEPQASPFFMAVGFMRPHVPWYVPGKWMEKFDPNEVILPKHLPEDWGDIPEMARQITEWPMMPEMGWMQTANRWEEAVSAYLACVTFTDHHIGRLIQAIAQSPGADNTIIQLTSDHGYHLGEKGLFQKATLWQRSTRIPLVCVGPGIKKGIINEPVSLLDLYPTLIDLCDLGRSEVLEGISLKPLLDGSKSSIGNVAITTYGPGNHSVVKNNWHYIRYANGSEELYDQAKDPNEWDNLALEPSTAMTRQQLSSVLPTKNVVNIEESKLNVTPYFKLNP